VGFPSIPRLTLLHGALLIEALGLLSRDINCCMSYHIDMLTVYAAENIVFSEMLSLRLSNIILIFVVHLCFGICRRPID
jgi:hypothetical protein